MVDERVPYVPDGTLDLTIAQVGTDGNGGHMTTYKAERYDYTVQAWIGTDGRYLCCAHLPEHSCQCYGRLHAGELAGGAVPTINEWPEGERRGYDRYAQEVALLGYDAETQRFNARCSIHDDHSSIETAQRCEELRRLADGGYEQTEQERAQRELVEEHKAIVREADPSVQDALRRLVAVLARERHAVYGQRRPSERELCRTWGEWLADQRGPALPTMPAEDDVRSSEHLLTCAEAERMQHDAWADEVYAAEEIERMADGENERISDL